MFGPNSREVVREFGKKIIELTTKGLETTKGKCGREKVMPNEGLRASQLSIPRFPSTFAKTGRTSPFPHIHFPSEPNGLERIAKHPFRGKEHTQVGRENIKLTMINHSQTSTPHQRN